MVLRSMGKKHPKKMIKAADFIPIPNHKIARGIQARGGMGLSVSTTGVRISLRFFDQPIRIPSGMARRAARKKPYITRNRL